MTAPSPSVLDQLPAHLAPFERMCLMQRLAAEAGWQWADPESVFAKMREEVAELEAAARKGNGHEILDEMGDVFIMAAILCNFFKLQHNEAIDIVSRKFEERFRHVEACVLASGHTLKTVPHELERQFYAEAKERQKKNAQARHAA